MEKRTTRASDVPLRDALARETLNPAGVGDLGRGPLMLAWATAAAFRKAFEILRRAIRWLGRKRAQEHL